MTEQKENTMQAEVSRKDPGNSLYRAYRWTLEIRDTKGGEFAIKPILVQRAKIKYIASENKRARKMQSFIEAHIMLVRGPKDTMGNLDPLHQGLMDFESFELVFCCYDGIGQILDKMSYICALEDAEIDADYSSTEVMKLVAKFKIKTATNKEDETVKADHEFIVEKQEELAGTGAPS